jgi:acetyl-CoA carboxylase biotin carboxyl carrier protein
VSKQRLSKSKKGGAPIILPRAFAHAQGEQGTGPMPKEQIRHIQELIDLLKKNNLTELELEREGLRIRVRSEVELKTITATTADRGTSGQAAASQVPATTGPHQEDTTGKITIVSPIVGTFYRSPSPDADPYVEEGDYVKKGQVLCIVEAMKLMNEIESEINGRVIKILAESTKPVEYGQALFLIDSTATH